MALMIQSKQPRSLLDRWSRGIELFSEAGNIFMSLRDRPGALDWLAVGARLVALGMRVQSEHRRAIARDPWDYFDDEGPQSAWIEVPDALSELVLAQVTEPTVVPEYWDGESGSNRIVSARLAEYEIGWIADGCGAVSDGPYLRREQQDGSGHAWGRGSSTEGVGLAPQSMTMSRQQPV